MPGDQLFDTAHPRIVVDPLAISVIIDTAARTGGKLKNCLCTLVGQVLDDGSVHVEDAFANHVIVSEIPGYESSALPESTHHDFMWQTRQKVNPREVVIGWGTTDIDFHGLQALSEWARTDRKNSRFAPRKRMPGPLMLKVDLPTETENLSIKGYMKGPIMLCLMKPMRIIIAQTSPGMDLLTLSDPATGILQTSNMFSPPHAADHANMESLKRLKNRIDEVLKIVQDVLDGKREPDATMGRGIYNAIAAPMTVTLDTLTKVEAQDNLLSVYMANLTKLQFALGQKLHLLLA